MYVLVNLCFVVPRAAVVVINTLKECCLTFIWHVSPEPEVALLSSAVFQWQHEVPSIRHSVNACRLCTHLRVVIGLN